MKAARIILGAARSPEVIQVMSRAYLDAWAELSHHFRTQAQMEDASTKLAQIILAYASEDLTDPAELKNIVLPVMALNYPNLKLNA